MNACGETRTNTKQNSPAATLLSFRGALRNRKRDNERATRLLHMLNLAPANVHARPRTMRKLTRQIKNIGFPLHINIACFALLCVVIFAVAPSSSNAQQPATPTTPAPTTATPQSTLPTNTTPTPQSPVTQTPTTQTPATQQPARQQIPGTPAASSPVVPNTNPATMIPAIPALSPAQTFETQATAQSVAPLTLDEAVRLALGQASGFQQSSFNERIVAEDVRLARAAFLPRVAALPSLIATTPALGATAPNMPRAPSFIGANAITEYQGLVNVAGELDISGRLRATLRRNVALLEAARFGTEIARRNLVLAVTDTYNALALASLRRQAAEQNLRSAQEFERITNLLLRGGEVAPVDETRARLQTATRRDELEQARTAEAVAADSLRVLVGYDFTRPIATMDLLMNLPAPGEVERFTSDAIARLPEFAQFAAERRAAAQDIRFARSERRPQVTYSVNGGFVTDSLRPSPLGTHTGASATVGVSIPLFDGGASRSRERQARLRAEAAELNRIIAARTFAQAFSSARTQAFSATTRISNARTAITDAEANLNASIARYRAGEGQIIEVTDAQNSLNLQRTTLYQAIFDYQTALSRLRQATGQ